MIAPQPSVAWDFPPTTSAGGNQEEERGGAGVAMEDGSVVRVTQEERCLGLRAFCLSPPMNFSHGSSKNYENLRENFTFSLPLHQSRMRTSFLVRVQ